MKMYALYPYNDMALRYVTNIISYSLDNTIAKELIEAKGQPKRISRIITMNSNSETATTTSETPVEDEQTRRDVLLVYMLFSTPLTELIMQMCQQREMLSFTKTLNKVEMGYVSHLTRLATIIQKIGEKNDMVKEQLEEEWIEFDKSYLTPRIEKRAGSLCRGKQFEKQKESRFLSMFDDDDDDGD